MHTSHRTKQYGAGLSVSQQPPTVAFTVAGKAGMVGASGPVTPARNEVPAGIDKFATTNSNSENGLLARPYSLNTIAVDKRVLSIPAGPGNDSIIRSRNEQRAIETLAYINDAILANMSNGHIVAVAKRVLRPRNRY